MNTKRNLLLTAIVLVITMSSFIIKPKSITNQVIIYGLVYSNQCNSDAYEFFSSKLVDVNNYYQEQKDLEAYLKSEYPNAKRIKMGSSKYDFGATASNMCVIKWKGGTTNCSYDVVSVHFGTTETDALNRAIKHKNMWGGSNVSYSIMTQKYW
ncbi:hypothetical protein [Flavobacterium granuli]|uniref:Uncharacterized protein n=1 Tax=Flavobacterium granuli TaxID=280093 RepID=A0A1M5NK55_9FLAO|nr:hypothetical protein [Flavobacterium granuli]PRZ23309.1 hypothetical protein BC624_10531 [Flavobacterium granuli]SHG89827.1 hypothetical protein SAMN05443373_10531 [Flavobacterium granuli]